MWQPQVASGRIRGSGNPCCVEGIWVRRGGGACVGGLGGWAFYLPLSTGPLLFPSSSFSLAAGPFDLLLGGFGWFLAVGILFGVLRAALLSAS